MQTMERGTTDERLSGIEQQIVGLDDRVSELNGRVDSLDREMHLEFRATRGEIHNASSEHNARFDSFDKKLTAITVAAIGGFVTMAAAMVGVFAVLFSQL